MKKTEIRKAKATMEGAGAEVRRLMPVQGFMNYDPFVLWDHFDISPDAGFPDHPHRGFEAITYIFYGSMQHADNLGNQSIVTKGGAQRFTAGSGLVHSEMPGTEGRTNGIQLWINLPKRLKSVAPGYQQVDAEEFPEQVIGSGVKRIIVGQGSPLQLMTPVLYFEFKLGAGDEALESVPEGFRGFVYLEQGELLVNGQKLVSGDAVFIEDKTEIQLMAEADSHFMFCFGRPHNEPIIQHGPYVL